jgi:alpha-L-glutamate ligase-like protein
MVLGINRRNALIARENPKRAIRLARDKVATKQRLAAVGVPVPATLAHLVTDRDVDTLEWERLPDQWVMKPQRGSRGRGVMVVQGRDGHHWLRPGGQRVASHLLRAHAAAIVDGCFTDGNVDGVLIEPLLVADGRLAQLAPTGLPDVRVICRGGTPLMAMLRLPTVASEGRGNLHQGGIGAAVDLTSGVITRAVHRGCEITAHPDTAGAIVGQVVPMWPEVLAAAAASGPAIGLGYVGVDLVVDAQHGVVVLEVNSHPGLEIQNINLASLRAKVGGAR